MLQLVLEAFLFLCLIFPSLQLFLNPVTERSRVKLEREGGEGTKGTLGEGGLGE